MKKLIILAISLCSFISYSQDCTDEDKIYTTVEVSAQFPQGIECFYDYLITNGDFRTEGKIIVQFVIEKNGKLTDIYIYKQIDSESSYEVIRLLEDCPKWNPAIQNGHIVRQKFVLPIKVLK